MESPLNDTVLTSLDRLLGSFEGPQRLQPRAYAGIGSRTTPTDVLDTMRAIAELLAGAGWTMRSGMSPGADQAFYRGALAGRGPIELYLPWPGFEDGARRSGEESSVFTLHEPSERAYELAADVNSGWGTLTEGARRMLARDFHQVLGLDLCSPVAFVVCWTPDGDTDGTGPSSGGTGQALRVASGLGIPVMNLSRLE